MEYKSVAVGLAAFLAGVLVVLAGIYWTTYQPAGSSMMSPSGSETLSPSYGPMGGSASGGQGTGPSMSPGMSGPWEMGGPYSNSYANINLDDAVKAFKDYVERQGSNFELIEVMEFQHNFYAAVKEKSTGIGAFELLLWRGNGRITPEPGPNMMWNLKYGSMSRYSGTYNPSIDEEKAKEIALASLRKLFSGHEVDVEEAIPFYGYYTLDYSVDGKITGMLSVNAFSGNVWYHTWHGYFISMKEVES